MTYPRITLRNEEKVDVYVRVKFVPRSKHTALVIKTNRLMARREL